MGAKINSKDIYKIKFKKGKYWGLLTSLDLHSCDGKLIRDKLAIKEYVVKLCNKIKMKRFGDTQVIHFGEAEEVAGFSMTQLIETSLISGHFANKTNNIYLDIFSCKYYNPEKIAEFTKKFFKAKDYDMHLVLRK